MSPEIVDGLLYYVYEVSPQWSKYVKRRFVERVIAKAPNALFSVVLLREKCL